MAYAQNGCGTLDYIYYGLEELSKENPQYKSLAALNCLILGYAKVGDETRALQTFEAIGTTFGLTLDIDSYNCLISAYLRGEESQELLQLSKDFIYLGVRPNAMTYELLFEAHITATDSKSALSIIEEMEISGLGPTKKALEKIYTCAIKEDNNASKDRVRDLAIKYNIPMSEKVFRERNEYAYLAPPKSYEEQTTLSWEDKFKLQAKKVSLRRIRRFEAREDQQEEFPFSSDVMYLI
ncbi:pentatricopeptide repeat-containing protein At1g26460, mitochondrial-like [Apium graveolens]|uniref:pentatricopeptide repeat-containing protein At1g26460, mitochondrial-like n=1 Tax=Apium graveolens TaxID=4045 RepID=UPI003D7A65F1